MKALALATVALALVSTPALASDKGSERCSNRHLAGSWLTTFAYGSDTRLACSFTLDRRGQIVASECMKDHVSKAGYTISGKVVADRLCQFSGEFEVPADVEGDPATVLMLRGEIAKDRDMMVGLIYPDVESFFEPLAIVRTADPRGRKLPKPQLPVDPDDEDEEEIEFACAAEQDGMSIEAEAEAFVGDATSTLHKFSAEFEAEPSAGLVAGDLIDFVVDNIVVGQAVLEDDGDGEVEAEIGFNSRGASFPANFPTGFGEGSVVKAMKGGTEIACTVALDD